MPLVTKNYPFDNLGIEKLGLTNLQNDVQLVLEEDGTEVDKDYLPFIQANTVLILLSENEHWSSQKGTWYRSFKVLDI